MNGQGGPRDIKRAMGILQYLSQMNDGNYIDALAVYQLGRCHYYGWGVKRDYAQARELFARAGRMGSQQARYQLGYMYEKGLGGAQDRHKAIDLYQEALRETDYQRLNLRMDNSLGNREMVALFDAKVKTAFRRLGD